MSMTTTSSLYMDKSRFWRVVPPEGVVQNQLGYTCAPNEGLPSYVACHDLAAFVAYGFYCSWLSPDEFSLWELLKKDDIKWLREYFLSCLESIIAHHWDGEIEPGADSGDFENSTDCILNVGNKDEGDNDECMVGWNFERRGKDGHYSMILTCSSDRSFGQEYPIWFEAEALEDKAYVRAVIAHARRINDLKVDDNPVGEHHRLSQSYQKFGVPDVYPAYLQFCESKKLKPSVAHNRTERVLEEYSFGAWYERFGKQ